MTKEDLYAVLDALDISLAQVELGHGPDEDANKIYEAHDLVLRALNDVHYEELTGQLPNLPNADEELDFNN